MWQSASQGAPFRATHPHSGGPAPALSPRPRRVLCLVGVGREEEAGAWRKGRGAGRKPGKGSSFCPSGSSTPPPPAWTSGPLIPPGGPGAPGSGPSSPSPLQTPGLSASMLRPTPPGPLHRRLAGALPHGLEPVLFAHSPAVIHRWLPRPTCLPVLTSCNEVQMDRLGCGARAS